MPNRATNIFKAPKRSNLLDFYHVHSSSLHGYSGADARARDHADITPFMLAVEKGHLEVAKLMVEKDPCLVTLQLGSGQTVIHWALERDLDTFFKVTLALFMVSGKGENMHI